MAEELRRKVQTFAGVTKTRKGIQLTLVTPYGTASNLYRHTVQSVVTLDDLFR